MVVLPTRSVRSVILDINVFAILAMKERLVNVKILTNVSTKIYAMKTPSAPTNLELMNVNANLVMREVELIVNAQSGALHQLVTKTPFAQTNF
jgi:hypothetical protein